MCIFHLIRHAETDSLGRNISGRLAGVSLNSAGRDHARQLADCAADFSIQQIVSSPLERCLQTAEAFASKLGLTITVIPELTEVDFGNWTAKSFAELDSLQPWKQWNTFRTGNRAPGGESMLEVQSRMVAAIERLRRSLPDQTIAAFSHADPIRALICYYLGMPLDFLLRLQIAPASLSTLMIDNWSATLHRCNFTVASSFEA